MMVVTTTTSVTVPRSLIVVVLVLVLVLVLVVLVLGVFDGRVLGVRVTTFGVDVRHGGNFQDDVVVAVTWPRLPGPDEGADWLGLLGGLGRPRPR